MARASRHAMAVIARLLGPAESASHQSRGPRGKVRRGGAVSPGDRGGRVARMEWRRVVSAVTQSGAGSAVREDVPALRAANAALHAGYTALIRSPPIRPIGLGEAVARVGHSERAVLLRRHFDPIGRSIVGGWRRRVGAGRRGGDRLDLHGGQRLVNAVGDEHSRYRVLLSAQLGEMNLPDILDAG